MYTIHAIVGKLLDKHRASSFTIAMPIVCIHSDIIISTIYI